MHLITSLSFFFFFFLPAKLSPPVLEPELPMVKNIKTNQENLLKHGKSGD